MEVGKAGKKQLAGFLVRGTRNGSPTSFLALEIIFLSL